MWLSTSEIGTAQPRSVKEIAPKSPFFCVNRSIPSGAGARAIRSGFYLGFIVWGRSAKWAKATSFLGGSGGMSPRNVLKWICAEMQSAAFWDTILKSNTVSALTLRLNDFSDIDTHILKWWQHFFFFWWGGGGWSFYPSNTLNRTLPGRSAVSKSTRGYY